MTPEEIREAYTIISDEVANSVAEDAAAIGNAQRSQGELAAAVASPSGQTSGLANYTYNRLLRPTVDTLTTSLLAEGAGQYANQTLSNALKAAQENYNKAREAYAARQRAAAQAANSGRRGQTVEESKDGQLNFAGLMAGGINRVDSDDLASLQQPAVIGMSDMGAVGGIFGNGFGVDNPQHMWQGIVSNAGSGGGSYITGTFLGPGNRDEAQSYLEGFISQGKYPPTWDDL